MTCEIQVSVFTNKILLEHSHAGLFPCCVWLLSNYTGPKLSYNKSNTLGAEFKGVSKP